MEVDLSDGDVGFGVVVVEADGVFAKHYRGFGGGEGGVCGVV